MTTNVIQRAKFRRENSAKCLRVIQHPFTPKNCKLRGCLHGRGLNNEATNRPATLPHPTDPDLHNRFFLLSLAAPPPPQILPPSSTWQTASKGRSCNTKQCVFTEDTRNEQNPTHDHDDHDKTCENSHLRSAELTQCPRRMGVSGTARKQDTGAEIGL